jgi:hypothetical protein
MDRIPARNFSWNSLFDLQTAPFASISPVRDIMERFFIGGLLVVHYIRHSPVIRAVLPRQLGSRVAAHRGHKFDEGVYVPRRLQSI